MEGAILFGKEPSTIKVKKAKYTIGKKLNCQWNDEIHSKKGPKIFQPSPIPNPKLIYNYNIKWIIL